MVIGNKLDLEDEGRAVSFNELEAFCEDHGAMGYMETSAKENMNVEQCFMQLAAKALKRQTDL
jgi:GTPase SAR1 family protein